MHMVCTPRLWQHKLVRGRLSMKESFFNASRGENDKQKKAERKKRKKILEGVDLDVRESGPIRTNALFTFFSITNVHKNCSIY